MFFKTYLILLLVEFDGGGVGEKEMVGDNVGLGGGVAGGAISDVVGASSGSECAAVVPISAIRIRFVQGNPILDPIAE